MFKKTAIAALVLGFSGAASAAMYAPAAAPACSAGNVTVPCEGNAWDLGIDLLYLRNQENILSGEQHQTTNEGFQADRGYGFRLEGSYHFGTGNDVNINWSHYSKTTSQDNFFVDNSTDELKSKMDVVNFELGQHIDVGEMWNLRVHGGLQYAKLHNQVRFDVNEGVANFEGDVTAKVRGFGPRVGMDSSYDFGNGFALFANGAVSILNAKYSEHVDLAIVQDGHHGINFTDGMTRHMTTTATDARIGAMYTHAMAQGDLTIRGGYQVNNFINANNGVSDLSWDGWFIGLKWVGNA